MSYYTDVYLKRMNKDGRNRQERIKTRKEHEFDRLFLKQTEYQVCLHQINEKEVNIICSLQLAKWNENSLISNLLVSTSAAALSTGDILQIKWILKEEEQDKIWLVLFVEENLAKGYQLFKIICLDDQINLTNEYGDTNYTIPVKFINASASFIKDTFSQEGIGYREPQNNRGFITADFPFLIKGTYFEHKERGWEIMGKDNISINNVSYTFISEKLRDIEEPVSSREIPVGEDTNFFLNGV